MTETVVQYWYSLAGSYENQNARKHRMSDGYKVPIGLTNSTVHVFAFEIIEQNIAIRLKI